MRKFILFVEFLAAVVFLLSLPSTCAPSGPPARQQVPCCNEVTCWC
ncbi:putative protein OS=Streptomyces griseomycini OX=66895 GN=FHS37_006571 PE=4 SV=1 [Streptomyces griseomycini]|uniref:Uncharacterized protein n=1 Tax=Streptomyces griseomycini TaxID=66895 RepID=A0A7W7VA16_9ACTN|nr:hypothetical protein [Streptomyces griseomycini]